MNLYFENSLGIKRIIGTPADEKEAWKLIHNFCEERNFKIWYVREWVRNGFKVYDVGSHTEFFLLELKGEN